MTDEQLKTLLNIAAVNAGQMGQVLTELKAQTRISVLLAETRLGDIPEAMKILDEIVVSREESLSNFQKVIIAAGIDVTAHAEKYGE